MKFKLLWPFFFGGVPTQIKITSDLEILSEYLFIKFNLLFSKFFLKRSSRPGS